MASDLPALGTASSDWYGRSPPRLANAQSLQDIIIQSFSQQSALAARISVTTAADSALAVHGMRRLLRRSRALLRLTASGVADADRIAWIAQLGDVSRILGRHRDAEVLPDALLLLPRSKRIASESLGQALEQQRVLARQDVGVVEALQAAAAAMASVHLQLPGTLKLLSTAHLAEGLSLAFSRVEECAKQATKRPRPAAIHGLRRRAKDLRYMLEWLGCDEESGLLRRASECVATLGDVADLLVLHTWLKEAARHQPESVQRQLVQELRLRKAELARRGLRDARKLIPAHPKRMAKSIVHDNLANLCNGADARV